MNTSIHSLEEIVMYANTPYFLWKHFRKSALVNEYALLPSDQLYESLSKIIIQDLSSLTQFYAIFIALLSKSESEYTKHIESIKIYNIQWIDELLKIAKVENNNPISSSSKFVLKPHIGLMVNSNSTIITNLTLNQSSIIRLK